MKLEEIIDALLENAKALHKLYEEVGLDVTRRIAFSLKEKQKEKNIDPRTTCMQFLLQKEKEYITLLEKESYDRLLSVFEEMVELIPIPGKDLIEQYIEGERYFLPLMRILRSFSDLLYRKQPILEEEEVEKEEEEEIDTITIDKNKILKNRNLKSTSEKVLDEIFPELEQQHMAHFINIASKKKELYKGTAYEEILNFLILDFIYLSQNLENHFLNDCHTNLPYTLFLVENEYPNYFSIIDIGEEAILDDHLDKLKDQLLLLPVKARTSNTRKAFLRCLYIEMLCEEIQKEQLEDFLANNLYILDPIFLDEMSVEAQKFLENPEDLLSLDKATQEEIEAYSKSNQKILESIFAIDPILQELKDLRNAFMVSKEIIDESAKKKNVKKRKKRSTNKKK